jgi:plasmid stabilization system protein ParE
MSRFFISPDAERDLDEIEAYLDTIPPRPATRAGESILRTIHAIADSPHFGAPHSRLTRLLGTEVRSRLSDPYRIFYRLDRSAPESFAILHTARDIPAVPIDRFQ